MGKKFKKKHALFSILFIIILCVFPLLWLIRFQKSGIVLDAFVNYDGTSWGDDIPAEALPYVIRDMFDNSIVASGTISEDGHVKFYPMGTVTSSYYRLEVQYKDSTTFLSMNNGSFSETYDKTLSPYIINGEFLWNIIEQGFPVVDTMPISLLMWDGSSWISMVTITTDSLGNADFYVTNGLFAFDPDNATINIVYNTPSPIVDTYYLAPIGISISLIIVFVFFIITLTLNHRKKVRGRLSFYFQSFISNLSRFIILSFLISPSIPPPFRFYSIWILNSIDHYFKE